MSVSKPTLSGIERSFLQSVSRLGLANPFLPERVELERQALGDDFEPSEAVWSLRVGEEPEPRRNASRITERVDSLLAEVEQRLVGGARLQEEDGTLLEDAAVWLLYHRHEVRFLRAMESLLAGKGRSDTFSFYPSFRQQHSQLLTAVGAPSPSETESAHLFACFFQVRRAFHHIIRFIVGGSMAAARLRAAVWQSIFSHDMRRYRRALYDRMADFSTLITGPLLLARRSVKEEAEAVAVEVEEWIEKNLGPDYPWPGNIRELEQCLRNVLIRRQYRPPIARPKGVGTLLAEAARRHLSADELLRLYCTWIYGETGSYLEAARRLGLDRRTVRAKVDPDLLDRLA